MAARDLNLSLHALDKVLAFLDGGFELRDGLGNHFLLKRSDFANAQVLLQAFFLEEREYGDT